MPHQAFTPHLLGFEYIKPCRDILYIPPICLIMPKASVSATPARASGSGLPADGSALEQLLHQTFFRFSAAKTALPAFPDPSPGPAAATATAPAAVAPLPKVLTPEEERVIMLLGAAPLVAPPRITRMLAPPCHGISPQGSPVRSAQPHATDDEEVLSEHSGLEVHARDDGLLDRDIEMQVEEPIPAPIPPPRPVPVQPALDTVSLGDPDDLQGDVNAWRATWSGDKSRREFRKPGGKLSKLSVYRPKRQTKPRCLRTGRLKPVPFSLTFRNSWPNRTS